MAVPIHALFHISSLVHSTCGKLWKPNSDVSQEPISSVLSPRLQGNRLLFAQTEGDGALLAVVVEPSWLGTGSRGIA